MLPEKLIEVISHEGVVSLTTWGNDEPNVTNTWNSYLVVQENRILIPAAGMRHAEADLQVNNRLKMTLGSREVEGFNGYQGTGFLIEATGRMFDSGPEFDDMKDQFPFLSRVLEVTVQSAKQLL